MSSQLIWCKAKLLHEPGAWSVPLERCWGWGVEGWKGWGRQAGVREGALEKMTLQQGLDQWFSTEGTFAFRRHLAVSEDVF